MELLLASVCEKTSVFVTNKYMKVLVFKKNYEIKKQERSLFYFLLFGNLFRISIVFSVSFLSTKI